MARGGDKMPYITNEALGFPSQTVQEGRMDAVKEWAEEISGAIDNKSELLFEEETNPDNAALVQNYKNIKEFAGLVLDSEAVSSVKREKAIELLIETMELENYEMVGFFNDFLIAWGMSFGDVSEIRRFIQQKIDLGEKTTVSDVMAIMRRWEN